MNLFSKIQRKWTKLRLQPIRVVCVHHVSDKYDASYMWEEDWTNTERLKMWIRTMQEQGYIFISLSQAYSYIQRDLFRFHKYVVLTADDGYKSLLNIIPWLEEQQIPITLFLNPRYIFENEIGPNVGRKLKESHVKITSSELYIKEPDLKYLQSTLITFAYHGYEHIDEWEIDGIVFEKNVDLCMNIMQKRLSNVVPFYAHTYSHTKQENDKLLREKSLTPVYVFGNENYNETYRIDRELISDERLIEGLI